MALLDGYERYVMTATYATRTGRPSGRSVVRHARSMSDAIADFQRMLERLGFSKIDIRCTPAAPTEGNVK